MSRYHNNRPIHPVPLKPRGIAGTPITTWDGWPADVRATLNSLNRTRNLSFYSSGGVFKCSACEAYCEKDDAACHFNGDMVCDECMVGLARDLQIVEAAIA